MASKNTDYASSTYQKHAGFVPLLSQRVIALLAPQPTERIIDLGAGDLVLTSTVSNSCAHILALDASSQLIGSGLKRYPPSQFPNMAARVVDCRYLDKETDVVDGSWDKVMSNAALHWILRDPDTRAAVFSSAYAALKPGGKFVAEMGGFGNIAEVHTALVAALWKRGVALEKVRETSPWCFPSQETVKGWLVGAGFEVELVEMEHRPTELSDEEEGEAGADGGVVAWMRMFGSRYLELVPEGERDAVLKDARDILQGVALREDGRWVVGYVRLRFVGRKQ